jgi:hypothetical protein
MSIPTENEQKAPSPTPAGTEKSEPPVVEVAVVGGGIAGLYCCHQLVKEKNLTIELYETSENHGSPGPVAIRSINSLWRSSLR